LALKAHSLLEIIKKASHTLFQTLCVVDALRFFNQFTVGTSDYTKEREQWLGELTLDQIVEEITANRTENR
jgi:Mg/Co/Ni transporter MgtE